MRQRTNRSIATRLVFTLVSIVTLVLALVGVVAYHAYRHQQLNDLESMLNREADQLAAGIALAVWKFDTSQIDKIMESAMQDQTVFGLSVEAGDEIHVLVRDEQWQVRTSPSVKLQTPDLLSATRDITFSGETIGKLALAFTPLFTQQKLMQTLVLMVGTVLLLDLLLIMGLYLLLRQCVLQPLKTIEHYASLVSSGRHAKADVDPRPLTGEFRELRLALKKMVSLLESQLAELTDSNNRFWKMVGDFPIALGIYSPQSGKTTFANTKLVETLGYTLEDIPDADTWFNKAFPDETYRQHAVAKWNGAVAAAITRGTQVPAHEYSVTCKDGSLKTIEVGGVIAGEFLMVVFNDVTERKQAEAEVQVYQEQLEKLVQQRTEELEVARDQAQSANAAKSIFLANMSHELRTPLNSIIGFSHAMTKDLDLTPRQQRNLAIINRSGAHLLTLINDILELSKIEAGKMEISTASVDLHKMLQEITEMLRPRAEQQDISLLVETHGLPPAVMVDAAKLRQILLNLVTNAVKFTTRGGVTVAAISVVQGEHAVIEFRVIDTGIGISVEDQQRVFDPFVQIGQFSERSGTGLGLTICRQYVQMLGGVLQLQSLAGAGSTFSFTLTLPISFWHIDESGPDASRITGVVARYRGYRILVADDVVEMRLLLRDVLESLGLEVLEAENGIQARELIISAQPHLVLMDWRMPGLDGVTLTRQVREYQGINQPKIIMLTANVFAENRQEALAAGVDDFMGKPIDMEVLYHMIERHVGIHFRREVDATVTVPRVDKLVAADLMTLHADIKKTFVDALRELNPVRINDALAQLRKGAPGLAARLGAYVEAMHYRKLWQLFGILDE